MIKSSCRPTDVVVKVSRGLPGYDFSEHLENPEQAQYDAVRPEGALFTYNMLATNFDSDSVKRSRIPKFSDLRKRGALRSVFDGRYRFTRYFSPMQHNCPISLEEVLQYNTIELFDHQNDPKENNNLAATKEDYSRHRDIIEEMNRKMNVIIELEIGPDVGQMLPFGKSLINWSVKKYAGF